MSQQVIPLLTDFKDIFTGKDGMFLNFHNAGGMDLWGVFFFFIASPYTLLVLFVDKADIIYLVNILTVLKMMTAAVTAQLYFRSCQKSSTLTLALYSASYTHSAAMECSIIRTTYGLT